MGEHLTPRVLDEHRAGQQLRRGGGDALDPARAQRDPQQPFVDLLRPRHQLVLAAQVVEHPGRGERDRGVVGEQRQPVDLVGGEVVHLTVVAVEGAERRRPGDQRHREHRAVALLRGDAAPDEALLLGDVGDGHGATGPVRAARRRAPAGVDLQAHRPVGVDPGDVLRGQPAPARDDEVVPARIRDEHATEVEAQQRSGGVGDEPEDVAQPLTGVHDGGQRADGVQPLPQVGEGLSHQSMVSRETWNS